MKNSPEHDHGPVKVPFLTGYSSTYVKLTKNRVMFVSEGIADPMAAEISALLFYFDRQDAEEPVELYIHTNGGSSSALINIYDVMQMISVPVKTVCIGKAFSAGAVLLAAGTKGERYAFKNSKIMIHGIQTVFPMPGQSVIDNKNLLDFIAMENEKILKILATHTGQPLEKVREDCKRDVWMSPEEALDYGIIDHIV